MQIQHGDIIAVPLHPWIRRYAYVRIVDYAMHGKSPGLTAQPYDYFSSNPESLEGRPIGFLSNQIRVYGYRDLLPDWHKAGSAAIVESDFVNMQLCSYMPYELHSPEDIHRLQWYCTSIDGPEMIASPCSYDEVRHLESSWENIIDGLPLRLYIEYCKAHQLSCEAFLDDEATSHIYLTSFNIPLWKYIPQNYRMKKAAGGISQFLLSVN